MQNGDQDARQSVGNDPAYFELTDLGNARRFLYYYGNWVRYCPVWRKFFIWKTAKGHWQEDRKNEVMNVCYTLSTLIRERELPSVRSEDRREDLSKWSLKCENANRMDALYRILKGLDELTVEPDIFDRDPFLLALRNGTINLQTGKLIKSKTSHYITKGLPINFDEKAECPEWLKFLKRILPDKENRDFLQRAVGYSLTGDVSEQCLFFMYGTGANGKTTFIETLNRMLGDYARRAPAEMLMTKPASSGASSDIARLIGSRFVVTSELSAYRFSERILKDLTGTDRIIARFMYGDYFEFYPTHKLWMYGNHKPYIRDSDEGIWRRFRLIPFTEYIPEPEQDKHLQEKLEEELPGIFNWALKGCKVWQESGLSLPEDIKSATFEYRDEMDIFGRFIKDICYEAENATTKASDLYSAYSSWAKSVGERQWSQTAVGLRLRERGFIKNHNRDGILWQGIGLKSDISRFLNGSPPAPYKDNDDEVPF